METASSYKILFRFFWKQVDEKLSSNLMKTGEEKSCLRKLNYVSL